MDNYQEPLVDNWSTHVKRDLLLRAGKTRRYFKPWMCLLATYLANSVRTHSSSAPGFRWLSDKHCLLQWQQ